MRLAAAGNLLTPAYLTLLAKGFAVRSEGELMIAEKGADLFLAYDPIELLGVIAVAEVRGEDWQASDEEIKDFMERFPN